MDGTTQLSAEDLMGWSKAKELANQPGIFCIDSSAFCQSTWNIFDWAVWLCSVFHGWCAKLACDLVLWSALCTYWYAVVHCDMAIQVIYTFSKSV